MDACIYDVSLTVITLIIGAGIAAYYANHYYKQTTKDLLEQTGLLMDQNNIMLRSMESAGMVVLNRDDEGNIIGIQHYASGTVIGRAEITASGTVKAKKIPANTDTENK